MKKLIALLMVVILGISLCACGTNNNPNSGTNSYVSTESDELSDNEIESLVASALYSKVGSKYDTADPGSTTYKINKTDKSGSYIYVYGSLTLYDKYGKATGGWVNGSGTPYRSFEVKINDSGRVVSCDIK